jgi:uncharacterized metal-binding protein
MFKREAIPAELRSQVFEKFGGCCAYCGKTLDRFHVDHVIPIAKGGIDDICNYFPSCAECNQFKNSFSLEEFRKILEDQTFTKCSFILAERYGQISVHPTKIKFWYEKLGFTFDEELVKIMMDKFPRIPEES